jgi:hypothetical protein
MRTERVMREVPTRHNIDADFLHWRREAHRSTRSLLTSEDEFDRICKRFGSIEQYRAFARNRVKELRQLRDPETIRAEEDGNGERRRRREESLRSRVGPVTSNSQYAILGVEPGATETEIKSAHRRLVKIQHPDVAGGNAESFQRTQAAYDALRSDLSSLQRVAG